MGLFNFGSKSDTATETEDQNKEVTLEDKVVSVLKTCYDPEIPVDVYELGLIYNIEIDDSSNVHLVMTLTSPNCPVAGSLPEEIRQRVATLPDVENVTLELTFDPPWSKDMMSEAALLELGFM